MNADVLRAEIDKQREGLSLLEKAYELLYGDAIAAPSPEAQIVKTLPAPVCKQKREDIPKFTVSQGVAPVRRGETRTCAKCGQAKGCTAFARGATVCRLCDVGGVKPKPAQPHSRPSKRRRRPPKEKPADTPPVERHNIGGDLPPTRFRQCAECDRTFQITAFPDRTKNVCKHCIGAAGVRE